MPNTPRVVVGQNQDITGRIITLDYQAPAYATPLSITCTRQLTCINVAQLTGALTINAVVTDMYIGDEVTILLATDGTQRVVTLGTNILSSGTVTIPASKTATVKLVFDGTNLRCISREITA
jgi:hypothetical protein